MKFFATRKTDEKKRGKMIERLDRVVWICLIFVLGVSTLENSQKHKRQIYREQVLPALGGKIPEEAFRTDRLALNRLNKEGITVIDGVLLETREHEKDPNSVRSKPEVIKVYVTQDSRYVPPEGRYHNDRPKSVDTTYVIRKPINHKQENLHQETPGYRVPISTTPKTHNYPKIFPSGSSISKAQGYSNFHRFVPAIPNDRFPAQHRPLNYQTIYKPIVTPLVIPARDILTFTRPYNYEKQYNRRPSSWEIAYDWNSFYQQSQPIFLDDSVDLFFDSQQIITDYDGFFNNFHGRSYRDVGSTSKNGEDNFSKDPTIRESNAKTSYALGQKGLS